MKTLKKVSILASAAILAGMIAFTACKKDDPPKGKKAADEFCDCLKKKTDLEIGICVISWGVKYEDYVEIDYEEFDINFKNKTFENDFMKQFQKCDAL